MRTFGWDPKVEELKAKKIVVSVECLKMIFLQDMVSVIDQDGDGNINFNEFVWLMTR